MMITRERELECARLVVEMQHYFAELLEERRRDPQDDLLTAAVEHRDVDGSAFDMHELLTILTIDLLASGNETTTAAIGSGLILLIEDPGVHRPPPPRPEPLRNLAEEIIRLESPAQGMFRRVTADTELGGVPLNEE